MRFAANFVGHRRAIVHLLGDQFGVLDRSGRVGERRSAEVFGAQKDPYDEG